MVSAAGWTRVVVNLDRIQAALEQNEASGGPGVARLRRAERDHSQTARRLLVELRKEMLQFAPAMRERELDPENVVVYCRSDEGVDVPCMIFALSGSGVRFRCRSSDARRGVFGFLAGSVSRLCGHVFA